MKNPELQLEIRSICKEIADYYCCDYVVYIGDSYGALDYVFDGHNMEYYKADRRDVIKKGNRMAIS